jgi:transposase
MNRLRGGSTLERGKELAPIRNRAHELWKQNPMLTASPLQSTLLSEGLKVEANTCQTWIHRWRQQEQQKEQTQPEPARPEQLSWDHIVKAVPDINTLGQILLHGFMAELEKRDSAYEVLKQENIRLQDELNEAKWERDRIASEFNEKLAKAKIGTLTLDQVQHRLIRKE